MLIEYNQEYHPVGQNLRYLRKKYSISRRGLAKLIGLSEVRLKGLEEGTTFPIITDTALNRLCEIFQIDANDLCFKVLEDQ